MHKFVTHEPIKDGWFNSTFSSGFGNFAAWDQVLTNSPEVLRLLCLRMEHDFVQIRESKRKVHSVASIDLRWQNESEVSQQLFCFDISHVFALTDI